MRNKRSLSFTSLILQGLIPMLILAFLLFIAFLGLAWFTDSLKLPGFLVHPSTNASATGLIINVIPEDASIKVNQQPYNPRSILVPGDYFIEVSAEGYRKTEENVSLHPNESMHLTIRLMPILSVQAIAEDASGLGWDQHGNLFFLDRFQGKVFELVNDSLSSGVDVPAEIYQVLYLPDGAQAIILAGQGVDNASKSYLVNLQTGELADLPVTGFVSMEQDGKTIWGINDNLENRATKPVWSLKLDGSPQPLSLDNPHLISSIFQILVDPTGKWLAAEGGKGIIIWEIASGRMVATFENGSTPVWIQNPRPGLAFLDSNHSLNFALAELNWNPFVLLVNVQYPIAALPGGSEIVFSRYNPFAGGTSFWAVDTVTMGVRLISEARIESGRAEQFTISLNGKKIAFVNDKKVLYLVSLEP